jgi:hypothetical protein
MGSIPFFSNLKRPVIRIERNPSPTKKLDLGDGDYTSKTDMIRFTFNDIKHTIHLLPAKAVAFIKATHCLLCHKLAPLKTLQNLFGKLWHASIILPAAHSFFTPINAACLEEERK